MINSSSPKKLPVKNKRSQHAESSIESKQHYHSNPIRTYCRSLVRRLVVAIDKNPKDTIIKGCLYIAYYSTLAFYLKYTYDFSNDPNFIKDYRFNRDLYRDLPFWPTQLFLALIFSLFKTIYHVVFPIIVFGTISYVAYSIPNMINGNISCNQFPK